MIVFVKNLFVTLVIILFYNFYGISQNKVLVEAEVISIDSIENNSNFTQKLIDKSEKVLEKYYINQHRVKEYKKLLVKDQKLIEKINSQLLVYESEIPKKKNEIDDRNDSITNFKDLLYKILKKSKKIDSISLKRDTTELLNKISSFKELNKLSFEKINTLEEKIKRLKISSADLKIRINKYVLKITNSNDKNTEILYKEIKDNLKEIFIDSTGGFTFSYKKQSYYAFISDLSIHKVEFHLNFGATQKIKNIKNMINLLEKKGDSVLMITNGGMYTPKNEAEGLLISNQKEIEPIDLESSKQMLNFYMMPNGVFYIHENKAYIEETNQFNKKYKSNKINPSQATQSGPMLVINDEHHSAFNHGSKSKKLRSGVGIMKDGRIVFIISKNSITNFHDFATIFKDIYGCENALFLDGVISKMYIKDLKKELGGNFGPIISICKM